MLKQLFLFALIICGIQPTSATAMSEELSKCLSLKDLAKEHQAWKAGFQRFQADADDTLTPDEKFSLQRTTLDLVLKRLMRVQRLAGLEKNNRGLVNDTSRFLVSLDDNMIARSSARYLMTSAIPKFEDALDDAFNRASINNEACDILPSSSSRSSSRSSGSSPAR